MTAIKSALSSSSPSFKSNADAMQNLVEELNGRLATAALGGDERSRKRHTERGKLLPRDRVERLIDPGSPFLELSPLAAFDEASLTVHMIQHILLMLVVPPLVLLGAPAMPLLHGLPQWFVRTPVGPFLRWSPIQSLGHFLTNPIVSWILAALALFLWHAPASFELALRSDAWHEFEHGCFLFTSILFWWPVIQPFPTEPRWPAWSAPLYLFLGMIPGSVLGAFLVFCDRVVYPSYAEAPKIFAMTPLEDQVLAGLLMWVLGFFVCVVPAVYLTIRLLSPQNLQSADAVHAAGI